MCYWCDDDHHCETTWQDGFDSRNCCDYNDNDDCEAAESTSGSDEEKSAEDAAPPLVVCSAYSWAFATELVVRRQAKGVWVPEAQRLGQLPFKACRHLAMDKGLSPGDALEVWANGITIGTYEMKELPTGRSVLALVVHRDTGPTMGAAFSAHAFLLQGGSSDGKDTGPGSATAGGVWKGGAGAASTDPSGAPLVQGSAGQVAIVDAFARADADVNNTTACRLILSQAADPTETVALEMNSAALLSPGTYEVRFDSQPAPGWFRQSAVSAVAEVRPDSLLLVLRVGDEPLQPRAQQRWADAHSELSVVLPQTQQASFPEEMVLFDASVALKSGTARRSLWGGAVVAVLVAAASLARVCS